MSNEGKSEDIDIQCIEGDFRSNYVAKVKEVKELFATFYIVIQLPPYGNWISLYES